MSEELHKIKEKAEGGDAYAQYVLGMMCNSGQGVPRNYRKALKWLFKAAEQDVDLQYTLGMMYYTGKEILQDYKEAFNWMKHNEGKDILPDHIKAFEWFMKAAQQGYVEAQIKLVLMYKEGHGVPRDYKKAFKWGNKAKKQMSKKSVRTLKSLKDVNDFLIRCKHCGDAIIEICDKGCDMNGECLDCHNEIQHKIVKNFNIHIVERRDSSRGGAQEDWSDCFNDMGSDFWEDHYS